MAKIKTLEWKGPFPPDDYCPYDHSYADSPLGRFYIEWKSWKDYDNYDLYLEDQHISNPLNYYDLKKTQQEGQAHFEDLVRSCFEE